MKRNNQIDEFEKGNAVSFYAKQVAKKLLHPTAEDRGKVARVKKNESFGSQKGISQPVTADKSAKLNPLRKATKRLGKK